MRNISFSLTGPQFLDVSKDVTRRLVRRLRAACRTHDTQVSACIQLSVPQVIAAIMSDVPWWVCVVVALIWPAVAFLSNLANPIPPTAGSDAPGVAEMR